MSGDVRTRFAAFALLGVLLTGGYIPGASGSGYGLYGFFNAPITRLKIPALTMADGPAGCVAPNWRPLWASQRQCRLPSRSERRGTGYLQ